MKRTVLWRTQTQDGSRRLSSQNCGAVVAIAQEWQISQYLICRGGDRPTGAEVFKVRAAGPRS